MPNNYTNWVKRRIVFPFIPLIVFIALLTLIMGELEKHGFIDTSRLDDRVIHGNSGFLKTMNQDGTDFYIIDDSYMKSQTFAVKKAPEVIRIVVFGGSFILGDPYVSPQGNSDLAYLGYGGICDWLSAILKARFPSLKFEVINAGISSANASSVLQAFHTLLKAEPDWILVMTGNNEGFVPISKFNKTLQEWIVYRGLKKTILPTPVRQDRPFFPPQIGSNLEVAQFFKENISDMVNTAKEQKKNLMLGTLPINLKFAADFLPGFGKPLDYPENDLHLIAGKELQKKGEWKKAIEEFTKSENQIYAARHIAQSFEALGDIPRAREFYRVSVEGNPRGQTRPSFNDYIRKIATKNNLPLVDLEFLLEKKYPDHIPEKEVFVDNCHMNWRHYHWAAEQIVNEMIASGKLQGQPNEPKPSPKVDDLIFSLGWENIYTHNPPIWGQSKPVVDPPADEIPPTNPPAEESPDPSP